MRIFVLLGLTALIMSAQTSFDSLVDRYFDDYFRLNPTDGTSSGFHQYDGQMEDYSSSAFAEKIKTYHQYLEQFEKMPASADQALVTSRLKANLLTLEKIGPQEKNPDYYSSSVTGSIFGLISRKFAPAEQRLQSVIAREKHFGSIFDEAKQNLKNPPRIYTEVALEQMPGIESFFTKDVPKAFSEVKDQSLLAEFAQVNGAAIASLKAYESWLRSDLLPRSNGDFRIGADNFSRKVAYDEMVDLPLSRLLEIGYNNLRENQRQLQALARQIDPNKTVQQIADEIGKQHPAPDQLLQTFQNTFNGLITFINEKHIITIPSEIKPVLEETPPFLRALTTASMDTPGPYEKVATEAYFNVTLPEKNWPAQRTEEFMTAFNTGTILSTAIHEAYPGHYVQLLWFQKVQGKARKLLQCGSNVEGWAHYTEQMMMDEGYGKDDPKLRFGQLLDALLRDGRYIVGIEMHTGKRTYEDGIQFFMHEAYMSHDYAERETKRGTSDPTYLVYTLGKLEILKLRADYQKKMGADYSLEKFHDQFMQAGGIPIKIIRQSMLGDDSPTLQ